MLTRRHFLVTAGTAAAASAAGLATVGYTLYIEPHWVETVHRPLPVKSLPPDLEGKTFVQLSDIHVGPDVDDAYVLSVFDHVRSLKPDIVAVTGDFISHYHGIVDHVVRIYPQLPKGKLATVGIFGNHDYGRHSENKALAAALHTIFDQIGLTILQNQSVDIEGLRLIGLDDQSGPFFEPTPIMATVSAGDPVIVLSHNPDTADVPCWGDFDGWILAGHTHGGQCKPPFFTPPYLPVENKRYIAGAYELGDNRSLYINRGIGHLIRARFNARPEVTVFSLTKAA